MSNVLNEEKKQQQMHGRKGIRLAVVSGEHVSLLRVPDMTGRKIRGL
jgi:hypothetical protein